MSTTTKDLTDPFYASMWGHPLFSEYARRVAGDSPPGCGGRLDMAGFVFRALHEIVETECEATDTEDPALWHLERAGDHLRDAIKYLGNAEAERRRASGETFPGGPPTWMEESEKRIRRRQERRES